MILFNVAWAQSTVTVSRLNLPSNNQSILQPEKKC